MSSNRVVPPHQTDTNGHHDDRYYVKDEIDSDHAVVASRLDSAESRLDEAEGTLTHLDDTKADEVELETHTSDIGNPHEVTASQVGLGSADNTADRDKPISDATQSALNDHSDHLGTLDDRVGGAETRLDDAEEDITSLESGKADQAVLEAHTTSEDNPHSVTASQVGLGNVENTADDDKPVSSDTQDALDGKADVEHNHSAGDVTSGAFPNARLGTGSVNIRALSSEVTNSIDDKADSDATTARFEVVEADIGHLDDRIDDLEGQEGFGPGGDAGQVWGKLSDDDYDAGWIDQTGEGGGGGGDISVGDTDSLHLTLAGGVLTGDVQFGRSLGQALEGTEYQALLDLIDGKADTSTLTAHTNDTDNPHEVTASDVGLGNVDNTSDADKPISSLTQDALDDKADTDHTHEWGDIEGVPDVIPVSVAFLLDGNGEEIETGVKGTPIEIPFAATIVGWSVTSPDSGSINCMVNRATYAAFPTFSSLSVTPSLSSAQKNQASGLNVAMSAGNHLLLEVDSVADITACTVNIRMQRGVA